MSGNYTGQVNRQGLKEGWGEILWSNGTLYGPNNIFYYSAGDKYFGQWKNDLQEGNGIHLRVIRKWMERIFSQRPILNFTPRRKL
jgi:hypothetical protein